MSPLIATDLVVNIGKEDFIEDTEIPPNSEERNLETAINTLMLMKRVNF